MTPTYALTTEREDAAEAALDAAVARHLAAIRRTRATRRWFQEQRGSGIVDAAERVLEEAGLTRQE